MSTARRRRFTAPETHPDLCPVCYSVPGQPCRWAINPGTTGTLYLGGIMRKVHWRRRYPRRSDLALIGMGKR